MDARYVKRRYLSEKVPGSFGGASGFIKNSKYAKPKEVLKVLQELKTYTLHKSARKKFPRRPIICAHIDWMWSMDIIIYEKYKRVNSGFSNVLLLVDCFSKFVMTEKLKGRTAEDVRDAILRIIKRTKRKPKKLFCDKDTSFTSHSFNAMLKAQKIEMYHAVSWLKASLAERYILRVKQIIARIMTKRNSHKWIDVIEDVTKQINNSYNRSLQMKSIEVTKKNESQVWSNLYSKYAKMKPKPPKFKVNDLVKIAKHKLWTEKGYEVGWSLETFKVVSVHDEHLVVYYRLADTSGEPIEGTYSNFDLQLVRRIENTDD